MTELKEEDDHSTQKTKQQLRRLIDEGLKSGVSDETVESLWESVHFANGTLISQNI